MADPTKVVRFPNRKKLHIVWSSPSLDAPDKKDAGSTQAETESRTVGDEKTSPDKPE